MHADPVEEARRILREAEAAGVVLRAVGGVAIALRSPSVVELDPPRTYHDIDLAGRGGSSPAIGAFLTSLGYEAADRFNKLNGSERLLFHDPGGRRIDVFIDRLRMCHTLELADRLAIDPMTLTPADLLLSKLQIVEITPRDIQDILALLSDHPLVEGRGGGIDIGRIRAVCTTDWAWWRTVTANLGALRDAWLAGVSDRERVAAESAAVLLLDLEEAPKSAAWRARSWLGERKRWYELPEEVR